MNYIISTQAMGILATGRHEKSGNLGDPGSRKILQIVEDLKEITNNCCRKASTLAHKGYKEYIKGTTPITHITIFMVKSWKHYHFSLSVPLLSLTAIFVMNILSYSKTQ